MAERSIDEIRREIEDDLRRYLEEHLIGRMSGEERIVAEAQAFAVSFIDERLPPGYHCRLVNPRMEGAKFVCDGFEVEGF